MARHKTSAHKGAGGLPTGARLVASVAMTAAGAGVLAAVLIPAGGSTGLHEDSPRTAHAAASRPAAPTAPAAPTTASAPADRTVAGPGARTPSKTSAAPSQAALIAQANAAQKRLDSTSPNEVLLLVNQARAQQGSAPLKLADGLGALARKAAADLTAGSAPGPAGPVLGTQWQEPGATVAAAANISRNEVGAQAAVNDWMKSPAERANLLNPAFHTMGVASRTTPDVIWWAQFFGK